MNERQEGTFLPEELIEKILLGDCFTEYDFELIPDNEKVQPGNIDGNTIYIKLHQDLNKIEYFVKGTKGINTKAIELITIYQNLPWNLRKNYYLSHPLTFESLKPLKNYILTMDLESLRKLLELLQEYDLLHIAEEYYMDSGYKCYVWTHPGGENLHEQLFAEFHITRRSNAICSVS